MVLRKLFERLGATYIKLGQFIASSPTLFPEEYGPQCQHYLTHGNTCNLCTDSLDKQWSSHGPRIPDCFSVCRYVIEFEKCLDKTDPVPWEVIKGRMRNELGRPLEDVFSYVDPVPLASASVAQVHAAGEHFQTWHQSMLCG